MSGVEGIGAAVPGYPFAVKVSAALPDGLVAPSHARALVRQHLADWGLADHVDDAEIVVSELVANAVRHGARPVSLTLETSDRQLTIAVEDAAVLDIPVPREASASDSGGRGLHMIDALSRRWGFTQGERSKVVWAELAV